MEAIFICCVMPVLIVLIICRTTMNADKTRAQVLMKAIEADNGFDADKLAESLSKPRKSPRELLNLRLLRGCIFAFIGIALLAVGIAALISGADFTSDPVTVPLIFGGASLAVGAGYLVVYYVTRKQVAE